MLYPPRYAFATWGCASNSLLARDIASMWLDGSQVAAVEHQAAGAGVAVKLGMQQEIFMVHRWYRGYIIGTPFTV
jgi:hypothetical protein